MDRKTPEKEPDLRCTFEDAERNHLLDGLRMSAEQKVAWFKEATALLYRARAHRSRNGSVEAIPDSPVGRSR